MVRQVVATMPAWKRRRARENDEELLQVLAGGLAQWIAERQTQSTRWEGGKLEGWKALRVKQSSIRASQLPRFLAR